MSAELTSVILLGLGCAANPWGIMIAVLLVEARRGHAIVWTYVVAWVGAITVVLTALLAGVGAIFEQGSNSATTSASVAELVLGLALLSWGAARVVHARRVVVATGSGDAPAQPGTPGWLHAIENIPYPAAFLLGIYSATYPLVIAAAGEILRSDASTAETVVLARSGDCSFETFLRHYELADPVLWEIGKIVHEADLADERYDAPEAPGLDVLLRGLSMIRDDEELLALSGPLFDGLYEYRKRALLTGREPA